MKEAEKILASKIEIKNAPDIRDKNRKKKQNKTFDSSYFLGKSRLVFQTLFTGAQCRYENLSISSSSHKSNYAEGSTL